MAPKNQAPVPATKKRKASTVAAGIFDRLVALDDKEAEELRNAPESIRERYAAKRAKLYEGAEGEVHELVRRFRGPEAPEFRDDEGPVSE